MRPISFAPTFALVIAGFFLISLPLVAQTTQEPSIAEAARSNREQKKTSVQSGKVITNDSISPATSASTPPNPSSSPSTQAEAPARDSATAQTASGQPELSPAEAQKLKAEIASLKQQLKEEQSDVELMKRLVNLDKEAYYSETDFARDTQGKAKLDSEQDELKQKEEAFAKLKAKLESIAPQETLAPAETKP
ncbi:MAG TPA: hypothetical protein VKH45_09460 [Candidatus Acidoferrum sp.]|nr:hypothetical protein [Candidatus Acidoferrum sp.]